MTFFRYLSHEQRHNIITWAEEKGHSTAFTHFLKGDELPALDDFDFLIVMGGFQSAWEEETYPWLIEEKKLIATALEQDKIVLGICFGAQVLAEVLGGKAFPNKNQEIGWHEVSLNPEGKESFLFRNVPEKFLTFHWHGDHFSLPPDCSTLAFSEASSNQAFVSHRYQAVGLQFHPEMTLDSVRQAAEKFGDKWGEGPYVKGNEMVLNQTNQIAETHWLMTALLDNMEAQFSGRIRREAES
ncbi:MAG: type 1 glutamine amidotransferase [Deltaproteobacteria bacterium]|nr:type 1 glutamine amidotransferase [Deltaproteobacteria bacterium]